MTVAEAKCVCVEGRGAETAPAISAVARQVPGERAAEPESARDPAHGALNWRGRDVPGCGFASSVLAPWLLFGRYSRFLVCSFSSGATWRPSSLTCGCLHSVPCCRPSLVFWAVSRETIPPREHRPPVFCAVSPTLCNCAIAVLTVRMLTRNRGRLCTVPVVVPVGGHVFHVKRDRARPAPPCFT